ncbi:MAG TPA: hypothetical protein VE991_07860 [Acidimicrobiales bacterium]|nr:hypothetical protein [Acidimicrobiales bacterium]
MPSEQVSTRDERTGALLERTKVRGRAIRRRRHFRQSALFAGLLMAAVAAVLVPTHALRLHSSTTKVTVPGPAGGPVPQGFEPGSTSFISTQIGWTLGSYTCSARPCVALLRTADGGTTWGAIPAPAPVRAPTGELVGASAVAFADASDGYAYGTYMNGGDASILWTTHDGGATWHLVASLLGASPFFIDNLQVTSSHVYMQFEGWNPTFIPGTSLPEGDDGHYRLAWSSARTDAFTLLVDLGTPSYAQPGADTQTGSVGGYPHLATVEGDRAFIVGNDELTIFDGTRFTSTGLGQLASDPVCADTIADLVASSATDLVAECGRGVGGGSMGARELYGTTDDGEHWVRLPDPPQAPYDDCGLTDAGQGHASLCGTSAGGSVLFVTGDFARTWHTGLSFSGDGGAYFGDLQFEDPLHGAVIHAPGSAFSSTPTAPPVLYLTSDGGFHWWPVHFDSR